MFKRFISLLICILFSVCFFGCGSGKYSGGTAPAYAAKESASETSYYNDSWDNDDWGMVEETDEIHFVGDQAEALSTQKLVYTGYMEIETLNYTDTVKSIREYIRSYGGIVESENEYDSQYNWYYANAAKTYGTKTLNLTVRIPTEHFDEFLSEMDGTGKVRSRSTNVENITRSYNSTELEIESLNVQQKRLLEMMEQAETVEDMITIESRLSEVEWQLKQANNNLSRMDTDINYSTIDLRIQEVMEYTADEPERLMGLTEFGERIASSWSSGWKDFVFTLQNLAIVLVILFPYLLILIPVIFLIVKLRKRKKAAKKAANPAEKAIVTEAEKTVEQTENK